MANVEYRQATCAYPGMSAPAVDSLDLVVEDGEFMVLVGPSGSGKSTALRMLAGLEMVSSGEILIGDRVVTGAPPKARDIAMVFQSYALYPHLSVADNLAFPLKQKGVSEPERSQRVLEAARLLELEPLLDRRPRQLSGGQHGEAQHDIEAEVEPDKSVHRLQQRSPTVAFPSWDEADRNHPAGGHADRKSVV